MSIHFERGTCYSCFNFGATDRCATSIWMCVIQFIQVEGTAVLAVGMRPRRLRNEVVPKAHTLPPPVPVPAATAATALPSEAALKAAAPQTLGGAQARAHRRGEATVPTTFRVRGIVRGTGRLI